MISCKILIFLQNLNRKMFYYCFLTLYFKSVIFTEILRKKMLKEFLIVFKLKPFLIQNLMHVVSHEK